jgi:peptidyl-prolyl cis-trans isomerase D
VTDKEIEEYVHTHKEHYKQTESRSIAFVLFDASATAADSAQLRTQLDSIKVKFAEDTLPARFLSGRGSTTPYDDMYRSKTEVLSALSDSNIIAIPKNQVYGPFLQQHSYVLAKMIDSKPMPDSVKARHILIKTNDPQTQTVILADSIAKKRIDSIDLAIKNGARFDSLAAKLSDDAGSAVKGGLLSNPDRNIPPTDYFTQGQMVAEFNEFCFQGKKGEKKIVKTAFGYHLIEILDQKNIQPYYKLAFFSKNIIAGKETERKAAEEANRFLNEAKDQKAFENAIANSNGKYKKLEATNIGPNDISIPAIDRIYIAANNFQPVPCRTLIKEIYKADKGDVLKPEKIGDPIIGNRQVVAVITDVLKEGIQPVYIARVGSVANGSQSPSVERILKDKKKAEQIKQMIGKVTTLEAAAAALKDSIVTVDSVRSNGVRGLVDPKVLGAVFNNANKGKVVPEPIAGNDAVFVVRVDDLSTTPLVNGDIETQKGNLRRNGMQRQGSPFAIFKKIASIRDYRKNFY